MHSGTTNLGDTPRLLLNGMARLKQRLDEYRKTAVLSWLNFEDRNPAADSSNFGPIGTL